MRKIIFIIFIFAILGFSAKAFAAASSYFSSAAASYGVPQNILISISYVESGLNPYTLDINGYPVYTKSYGKADIIAKYFIARGYSVDMGLMQINYNIWGKKLRFTISELLSPKNNIAAGAYILKYYLNRSNSLFAAVGKYHSDNYVAGRSYAKKVFTVYNYIK